MAEVVDRIVAELIAKADQYVADFDRATAAHGRFLASTDKLKGQTFDLAAEGQKYKQGAAQIAQAEQQTSDAISRARKKRSADSVAADRAEAASAKATADTRIREAERAATAEAAAAARAAAAVERGLASRANATKRGSGAFNTSGYVVRADDVTSVPHSPIPAAVPEVAAEREVNTALIEQARLQAGIVTARGEARSVLRQEIADMRTFNQLVRAGLTDEAAAVELDRIRAVRSAALAEQQALQNRSAAGKNALRFAEGAGIGRSYGSTATVAGVAAGVGIYAGIRAVESSVSYAKDLQETSRQIGLTTQQLQVYQAAARQAGVSSDQFRSATSQLSSYLGRAREGDEQAAKTFTALGINIKTAASAGDLLPTLIDRLSSIADPAQRAAVETRLFGEAGRQLDSLLAGGNEKISELAANLQKTGAVLSSGDIQKLNETANKLAEVKAQLQADIAGVVANNASAIERLAGAFASLANAIGDALPRAAAFGRYIAGGGGNPFAAATAGLAGFGYGLVAGKPDGGRDPIDGDSRFPLPVQRGKVNSGALDNLFAPKGPKGKSADQLAAEAEERTKRFNDQLAQFQDEQLRAQEDMTGSIEDRAKIEDDLAKSALARRITDIDSQRDINVHRGANAELENARAAILKDAARQVEQSQSNAREQQIAADHAKAETAHAETRLETEADLLQSQLGLARTAKERLDIEQRLLANAKERERAELQGQLASLKPDDPARRDVQSRLDSLDTRYAAQGAVVAKQNQGPLGEYLDSLPRTAADVDEAFQRAAVHGMQAANDQLESMIGKFLHLHGAAGVFLEDIIKIGIEWAEAQLKGSAGGAASGGGLGGLLGGIGKIIGSVFGGGGGAAGFDGGIGSGGLGGGLGFANGGSFTIGGNPGIDRNIMSINGRRVAKVGMGETVTVSPNVAASNAQARSAAPQMTVLAPRHFDLSNTVIDRDTLAAMNEENRAYARQVAAFSGQQAVGVAGQQAPAIIRRQQVLG